MHGIKIAASLPNAIKSADVEQISLRVQLELVSLAVIAFPNWI